MAQLPIVEGSLVSTPSSGAGPISSNSFREAALAPGKLAGAIGQDVGDLFGQLSQQIQQTRNAKKVFDADLTMRATKEKFLDDISKDPNLAKDPGTWVPAIQERVKQTQDSILNQPDLAPVVKRHLTQMAGIWGMDVTSEVRTQALRKEQADNYAAGIAVATKAAQSGDEATATAAYKSLNELGLLGPKETKQKIAELPGLIAESQANTVITENPENAPKIIESQLKSKLSPQKFRVIHHVAQQAQARAQSENEQELAAQIDDNPLHTIEPDQLKAARDTGHISATGYEKIQNRIKGYATTATKEQDKTERDDFNVSMMEADTPPTDGKALDTWAKRIKDNGLAWTNPALRRRLNEYVDAKVKSVTKEGEQQEKPLENEIFKQMQEDRNELGAMVPMTEFNRDSKDATYSHHITGGLKALRNPEVYTDEMIKNDFGPSATREKVMEAEKLHAAQMQQKMRDWFKNPANKDATVEQANEARVKFERPWVMSAVAKAAQKKPRLVKQDGKVYNFDTGQEVK